ncbi:hypothetical protein AGMMS50256_29210 [Betaproteobacteria bacterium]|nr:hypothetical protein AGMMS50256_29210 [Betaproteobacteria bacterium]
MSRFKSLITIPALAALTALTLSGCASTDYNQYVQAQQQAFSEAQANQKPLLKIVALPGQSINLQSIEVNLPVNPPQIQQARPNEWAPVLGQGLQVVGTVLGIKYAVDGAVRLSDSAGRNAAAGYPYVQAPAAAQANITNTSTSFTNTETTSTQSIGGDGVLGNGVYGRLDATSAPTVVTQPSPVIVPPADPVIVTHPPPLIVYPEVVTP